jgi:outer membrane protein
MTAKPIISWHGVHHAQALGLLVVSLSVGLPTMAARSETLEQAWIVAAQADPGQAAIRAESSAARAELRAAEALRLPVIDLNAAYVHLDDPPATTVDLPVFGLALPISGDHDIAVGGAAASYAIFTSGQVSNAVAGARVGSAATALLEQAGERDLRLAVAKAYFDVLRCERALGVFADAVQSLEAHVRDLHNFAAQGLVPRTDVLAAELLLADMRQQQVQAGNRTELARASYNRRLGRSLDTLVKLDEPSTESRSQPNAMLATLLATGEEREEILALQGKAEAMRYRAKAARAAALPVVLVGGGYVRIDTDSQPSQGSWFAAATVRWRIFDGGKAVADSDRYRMDARAADDRAAEARGLVALDIRRAWLSVRDAHDRLIVAQAAMASADENLSVNRDRFRQGVGTSTSVLDAERDRSSARLRFYMARYDGAYADIDLKRSAGLL